VRHPGETGLIQGARPSYFFAMPFDLNGARVARSETGVVSCIAVVRMLRSRLTHRWCERDPADHARPGHFSGWAWWVTWVQVAVYGITILYAPDLGPWYAGPVIAIAIAQLLTRPAFRSLKQPLGSPDQTMTEDV
jgi:hypothetical protein